MLFLTYGDQERLKDKAVWFLRNLPNDSKKKQISLTEQSDNDVLFGEITPNTVPHLNQLMENIYQPFISALKPEDWGVCEEDTVKEFETHTEKFAKEVQEAIGLMNPDKEMFKLD